MRFTLKNIGKINSAEIELQGITIIAGENNTGKSTIGKMLFSVYDSFYRIQKKIYDSLLIFNDLMNTNISFCRENIGFILVYNESKNSDQNSKVDAPSPSRVNVKSYAYR